MMTSEPSELAKAVLDCDADKVMKCLIDGASPDETHGHPLIIHAALLHHPRIFALLLEHGSNLAESFLPKVISWELGDWILQSDNDEDELIEILQMIRSTKAWLPFNERRSLADRLDGYQLPRLIQALTDDTVKAEPGADGKASPAIA